MSEQTCGGQVLNPKVFISYSWTSDEHVEWVVRLAERLVGDGVSVVIDQWDLKEGHDKYVFMEQMATDGSVSKVLAVCDKAYAEKANSRKGGVGTESQIISKEVYEKVGQEKFIPLIRERDEDGKEHVPVFFASRIYIDFSSDDAFEESYDKLLRNLFGRPERKRPPLGQPPAHLFENGTVFVKPAGKLHRLKGAVERGKPHTQALLDEYLDCFVDSLEDFRISYRRVAEEPFDETVVASVKSFLPYRDNFVDLLEFVVSYMNNDDSYDSLFSFFERLLPYQFRPMSQDSWYECSFDNYRFITYELMLYLIATLIRAKRYAAAARFMEGTYHFTQGLGGSDHCSGGLSVFHQPILSLDEYRNNRLKLNRFSATADLILERATRPKTSFPNLCQADFLMFIRPYFLESGPANEWWHPRCVGYARRVGTLELFARATSEQGMRALQHLLKVKTLQELVSKFKAMFENLGFARLVQSLDSRLDINLHQLLNLDALLKAASVQK